MLGTSVNCEMSGWKAALQKGAWGCCSPAGSVRVHCERQEGKGHLECIKHSHMSWSRGDYPAVLSTGTAPP